MKININNKILIATLLYKEEIIMNEIIKHSF